MSANLDNARDTEGDFMPYAWPGGYPVLYLCADGGGLCAACANGGNQSEASEDEDAPSDWRLIGFDVLEEPPEDGSDVRCDHCNTIILHGDD